MVYRTVSVLRRPAINYLKKKSHNKIKSIMDYHCLVIGCLKIYKKDYVFGTDNVYIRVVTSCVDDLAHGDPSVCITVTSFANYFAKRYVNEEDKPIIKMVRAVFYLDKGIEQASSYYR